MLDCEYDNVRPDVVLLGKALSGGSTSLLFAPGIDFHVYIPFYSLLGSVSRFSSPCRPGRYALH